VSGVHVVLLNQYYAPAEAATAQLLADLGGYLSGEGHRVSVVCSRRSYPDPSLVYPPNERIEGVSVHRTWTTGFGRTSRLGRMCDYLGFMLGATRVLAVQREVDVVVSLTTPPLVATLGFAAARLCGARFLNWVMDVYPELAFELGVLHRRSAIGRLLAGLARFTLQRADGVIAIGETMARRLRDAGAPRVAVVHNWADGGAIRPCPRAGHALRQAWGWADRFVVLYSGNLGLTHEFDTALDAADALREEERVLFAFVGDGPRRPYVEREVARRGLTNVTFRPHVDRGELGQSLTAGDVHLVTLRDAVAGLVVPSKIYGVLAAGRPTLYVGPEQGEIGEIVRGGRCGIRVAIGDHRGLAQALRAYLHDEQRRCDDGRRARELFERRFTKERMLEAHRNVIESLADDPA
jgi:glycosyltransferase involved in cell wall biosynthesis